MGFKGPKRKRNRNRELANQELQLKRKRARTDKLQQIQGVLFEDAGEQQIVFEKNSKRDKKGLELNPEGTEGEHELNANHNEHNLDFNSCRNRQSLNPSSSFDEHRMNPECGQNGHSKSRKEGQVLNPESINNGQQFNSKKRKKEQKSNSARSNKELHSNSGKMHNLKSECSIQGHESPDAKDNNDETLEMSVDIKKNKKIKKKRDRWGQILNDAGNTQDTCYDEKDPVILDNVGKPKDAAHATGNETLAESDSHKGEYDNKTVCAGGMPYDTSEEDILLFFKECGTVARVVCMKFADTQRFKGLAFITFETETAAAKALSLDGANMGNRHITVEKARAGVKVFQAPPKREAGSLSVYVGNLDWGVQKIDIKRFFKGCDIDNVRLAVHKNTGDFRGYGHVDFSDEKSLEKAIKMNQKQLLGRPVKVSYAVPKGFKGKSSHLQ